MELMRRRSGNDLLIATSLSGGEPLMLTKEQRSRHLYATGSTGSGKSKFLEYLIRQDILNCLEPNHVGAAWLFRWSRHKLVSDWSEEHKGAMMNPHLVYRHRAGCCETWSLLVFFAAAILNHEVDRNQIAQQSV
jgi:hypothetical protein